MQESNARTLRGVSIAVIVLSVLAIVSFGLGAIAVGAFGAFMSDPSLYGNGISIEGYDHGAYDSLNPEAAATVLGVSMAIVTGLLVWCLICSIVSLVAGIMGLRNNGNDEKLGAVFGWTIAGAVASFLCGRIITAILLVVAAVYTNKLRNPQPVVYGQPQPPYAQPYPGQQAPAYGQQPYQPQPQAYQQPPAQQPYQQAPTALQQPADQQQPPTPPAQ